ncbi:MAG: Ig-like domain repeat protein [Terracidiphilus sp.]
MNEFRGFFRSHSATMNNRLKGRKRAVRMLLCLTAAACGMAAAQTTTISGTVYDPRTTSASLPLPNVLVYATTNAVAALPSGVQCLTYQAPTDVVSYTYTAVDGTFTLSNIPENGTYTIVIQAGKWQRQFANQVVGTAALTGLALHMPANHSQGNIPTIAVATGRVDGAECVLLHMGIDATEFTDDNGTTNPGGHIHLYRGDGSPGAEISSSTPLESALTNDPTTLSGYDMVMFPCQGGQYLQTSAELTNLVNYAGAGGRVFATHYSYVYLDPSSPMDAQFAPVADWTTTNEQQIAAGVGTVSTNFSDGATLAQWLQNAGATVTGSPNEIDISTLRTDVSAVIPPTQSWLTLNSGSYAGQSGNPVMQMTFNAPVGAAAANQCGRVMFNDYHVINVSISAGTVFPDECPAEAAMSAQEEMLEYALFDLSTFVQPVVVPTLGIAFQPSPLAVKGGDTGDQVTVSVTNTSTTTQIDSSATLTFTLPAQTTVTAMSDATLGWSCKVSTLTCTRNGGLAASATDSVTLTLSVGSYTTLASYTGQLTATVSSVTFSSNVAASDNVIFQQSPAINWATPAAIVYGTPLGAAQLDASSAVAGSFSYSPAAGTVLSVGQQTLTVTFTPSDTTDYTAATSTVTLNVVPATPAITLSASANPVFQTYAVTFTASLPAYANSQTGTMTFYDGSTAIGTATVADGSAAITTTALTAGNHSITAAYSGDSNYGPGTSAAVAETIQDFGLAFAGGGTGTATAPAGGQAVYTLTITPVGGATLPAGVNLTVTDPPLGMTRSFSPAAIATGAGTTTVTLTIALPGKAANEQRGGPLGGRAIAVALGLILLPFAGRLRAARAGLWRLAVLVALSAALLTGVTGCGGLLGAQNFTFTVTANSGALSHSVTAQLTVK